MSYKFLPYFRKWQDELTEYGYTNFTKVLNAKDYGVPQNRERVFMVSILDPDGTATYHFPEPFTLEMRLKDILEKDVDERYYLSDKTINMFIRRNKIAEEKGNGFKFECVNPDGIAKLVKTRAGQQVEDNFIKEPAVLSPKRNEYGKSVRKEYEKGEIDESRHNMTDMVPKNDCISNTITSVQKDNLLVEPFNAEEDGTCRTLKAQYGKNAMANFIRGDGLGATAVKVIEPICLNPKVDGKHPSLEHRVYDCSGISTAITTGFHPNIAEPVVQQVGNLIPDRDGKFSNPHRGSVYSVDGISPTIHTMGGGNLEPKIVIGSTQAHAYVGSVDEVSPCINSACGMGGGETPMVIYKGHEYHDGDGLYLSTTDTFTRAGLPGISRTINAAQHDAGVVDGFRIRKLTERECFRLMDVDDADIDKIQAAGISRTQQYKLAGNSIVVACLYHIFRKLFIDKGNENSQMTLF